MIGLGYRLDEVRKMSLRQMITAAEAAEKRLHRETKLRAYAARMAMAEPEDFKKFMADDNG